MHLRAEFQRIGVDTPLHAYAGICTMRATGQAMPWARRSLVECCAAAGLPDRNWHTARDDALAAADLLGHLLRTAPTLIELTSDHRQAASWPGRRSPAPPSHRCSAPRLVMSSHTSWPGW